MHCLNRIILRSNVVELGDPQNKSAIPLPLCFQVFVLFYM